MKLVAWKYFSVMMALVLVLGTGAGALTLCPVTAAASVWELDGSFAGAQANASDDLLQFTSSGHVLGFSQNGVIIGSGSHMLRTNFVNGSAVAPQVENGIAGEQAPGQSPPLGRVTYRNVWDGVTVVYEATPGAIVKSTYYVDVTEKGIPVERIRLGYNRPLSIDEQGNLVIAYEIGTMVESAPVAWQEIDGIRVPVGAFFVLYGEREAGFSLDDYVPGIPVVIDPALAWNTFLGGSGQDGCSAIAIDGSGNVYVAGYSTATWGSPKRAYTGAGTNAFAAKLADNGTLIWNTFLGSSAGASGKAVAVDASGNVYVAGLSSGTWAETPVRAYTASTNDAFAAKLGSDGVLAWYTFMGGSGSDEGYAIAADGSNVYVAGSSNANWDTIPTTVVRPYTTGSWYDAFAVKINSTSGAITWHTFLGGIGNQDQGSGIAVDGSGNVFVAGNSDATWQGTTAPVRLFDANYDAWAAKLGSDGVLAWNTFLGGSGYDYGNAIALYDGNIYVAGTSNADWGSPVRAYTAGGTEGNDAFCVKLTSLGALTWNTFLGGDDDDYGYGVAVDGGGNVCVAGSSKATWGTPWRAYRWQDAFASKLTGLGALTWNTFLGCSGSQDTGYGIAVDGSGLGNVYVSGASGGTWNAVNDGQPEWDTNNPVRAYSSSTDGFAAKITHTAKSIPSYRFNIGGWRNGVINGTNIAITVPFGTNVTALVAYFITTGASIKVGVVDQVSGTTANNFTNPVTYRVTADDASTQDYIVTVTSDPDPAAKAITAFSFQGLAPPVIGVVNEGAKTVALTVPFGTNVTALIATFTTTGASVKVGAAVQTSGTTPNNFTSPLTYTVTAANATTQNYIVTVTIAPNPAKAITAFNFNGLTPAVIGVVNEGAKTIALTVPSGTNVTSLIATFTTTGASLKVGAAVQTSGTTPNNFTSPVTYRVTAADASTQDYVVTVTIAAPPPPPPPTPDPNPLIGTGAPISPGGSGAGSTSTTTTQSVSITNIQTQSASLSAKTVTPGIPVTVTADIINKGTGNGSKKVTLYVNGQVESTQGVVVNSGGSSKLTFSISRSEPGDYTVYVDGVPAGSFKVELFRESDGILIFSAVLVGLAFILGMIMLWRRQRAV
jgi:hypothetical protein